MIRCLGIKLVIGTVRKKKKYKMSTTPWTVTRFVRWGLRKLAPRCFACRFPIDDEPEHGIFHSKPPLPILRNNTMAFEAKRKLSRHRKCNVTRGVKPAGSSQAEANGGKDMNVDQPVESTRSDESSNWSKYLDEDYIIFSFREDGSFEVLNNDKTDGPSTNRLEHSMSRNSRPVNRKLNYERNTKTVLIERCSNIEETNYPTNYGDCINYPQKEIEEEEENINNLEVESVSGANFEEYRVASTKSRDSTHSSNASTGSFAFPILRWEWSGSPERMPNSEGLPFRKHKAHCVGFLIGDYLHLLSKCIVS